MGCFRPVGAPFDGGKGRQKSARGRKSRIRGLKIPRIIPRVKSGTVLLANRTGSAGKGKVRFGRGS